MVLEHVPSPDPMANAADITPCFLAKVRRPARRSTLGTSSPKNWGAVGMGRVFAARDVKLGRDVAIKLVSVGTHEAVAARASGEGSTHGKGRSRTPILSPSMTSATFAGEPYLWCRNCCAAKRCGPVCAAERLSPERALDLALQLARGLTAAHEQGVVHRDIKPTTSSSAPMARSRFSTSALPSCRSRERSADLEYGGRRRALRGAPAYMSPEQIQGVSPTRALGHLQLRRDPARDAHRQESVSIARTPSRPRFAVLGESRGRSRRGSPAPT